MKGKAQPHTHRRALGSPRAPVRDRSPHPGLLSLPQESTRPTDQVRPSPLGDSRGICCEKWGLLWDTKKEDPGIECSTYYGMLREGIKGWERICVPVESRHSVLLGDWEPQQPPLYGATGFGNF